MIDMTGKPGLGLGLGFDLVAQAEGRSGTVGDVFTLAARQAPDLSRVRRGHSSAIAELWPRRIRQKRRGFRPA